MTARPTRRQVLAAGGAVLGGTALAGRRATAQSDLSAWLSNADGGDRVVDRTG